MPEPDALTTIQRDVIESFFALPESAGFILAGGAALLAAGLSTRPTQDVDFFGTDLVEGVSLAADAFEQMCTDRAWGITTLRNAATFRRLQITTDDQDTLLVDFAIDSPPTGPPFFTAVAPTYSPHELAARKVLALFDRAAARDFADVHTLSARFDLDDVIDEARQLDLGFDLRVFVSMLGSIDRFRDDDLAATGSDPATLRSFFDALANRLRTST